MLGLVAKYLNLFQTKKVAIVVPNDILAADQQKRYAPWSSKDSDTLVLAEETDIHYVSYQNVLSRELPSDLVLLVDEIDSFFFNDEPHLQGSRLVSSLLLLNKHRVMGTTATFRGEKGTRKLLTLLKDVGVIYTGPNIQAREL